MIQVANIVKHDQGAALNLPDGSSIKPLSPSSEDAYCIIRGTIPPDGSVPLHSHSDAESFYVLDGEAEALMQTDRGLEWGKLTPGDFIHIPGGAKHAWRNPSTKPLSTLVACTAKLGRALREMAVFTSENGTQFPSQADMQRIVEISERYGYWLATPEENAAVGIVLP
jgi:quercetin dioxygenase-like cupin family protein